MSAEDLLRLGWHADRDGREPLRDALLTLAVAESGADDAVTAERCRRWLIARRPDHWFASFPTLGQALVHSKVADALDRLRLQYPPIRVRQLLLRGEAQRGPYTGRPRPLAMVLDELLGPLSPPLASSGWGSDEVHSLPFPMGAPASASSDPAAGGADPRMAYYLGVLMAIAILLASTLPPAARDHKAA